MIIENVKEQVAKVLHIVTGGHIYKIGGARLNTKNENSAYESGSDSSKLSKYASLITVKDVSSGIE